METERCWGSVFDEDGNHVGLDEDDMPQELIDLLDEESEH